MKDNYNEYEQINLTFVIFEKVLIPPPKNKRFFPKNFIRNENIFSLYLHIYNTKISGNLTSLRDFKCSLINFTCFLLY